jgi:phage terminase small subunit
MKGLNQKQLLFVSEYLRTGNATESAIKAGYSKATAEVQASRLLRNVKIQEYIRNAQTDIKALFMQEAKKSLLTIMELRDDEKAPKNVRLKAAQDILDRAGYKPTEKLTAEIQSTNNTTLTTEHKETHIHLIEHLVNTDPDFAEKLLLASRNQRMKEKENV